MSGPTPAGTGETGASGNSASVQSGTSAPTRVLLRSMITEEWRMHTVLFGGRRFAAFPVFVALMAAGAAYLLDLVGVGTETVTAGIAVLVFIFGLNTGTVGFIGRDAMRNVLGDITLLVFTSRTLPVSRRRLLALFVLKDLAFYAVLFLVPVTLALVPSALGSGQPGALAGLALFWVSLVGMFTFGIAITLTLVAFSTRGAPGRLIALASAIGVGVGVVTGVDVLAWTPYALYRSPSVGAVVATVVPIVVLFVVGFVAYDPSYTRPTRRSDDLYSALERWIPGDDTGTVRKSLLDVHRSSGSFWKVAFSGGVLFLVTAALLELVETVVGTEPSTGLSFGALLGLVAFTSYNWLTQFDSPTGYLPYPLEVVDVLAAKWRAFLALSLPTGLGYLAVAAAWRGADPAHLAVGAVLLVGIQVYLFGLTVYLAGFSPNEFLFDTVLFAAFSAAVAVPLVPILIVGFVVSPVGLELLGALVVAAGLLAGVGVALYRRAAGKWTTHYLAGGR